MQSTIATRLVMTDFVSRLKRNMELSLDKVIEVDRRKCEWLKNNPSGTFSPELTATFFIRKNSF